MSARKTALGRGFESLIPTELFDDEFDPTSKQDEKISSLLNIDVDKITTDKNQPRKNFDEDALMQLAESIKIHGVLQPIVVVKKGDKYQIVAGERRFRASKLAGKKTIPAIVRKLSDQNRLELSLIENIQRRDLSVVEVATSYLKLRDQFSLTLAEIGSRVGGKSVGAVSNTLRLLRLPKQIIAMLDQGKITEGQARPLIGLDNDVAVKLAEQIESHGYSARQVEQLVKNLRVEPSKKKSTLSQNIELLNFAKDMSDLFKAKVVVRPRDDGAGKIEISYKNQTEFERIKQFLKSS